MTRFRRSGRNWEGRPWRTPPALNALMDEIEARWPASHRGDGTVASKTHDTINPTSDHRPWPYTGPGVVTAVDAGETTENDGRVLFDALIAARDPRMKYAIHEGLTVWSTTRNGFPPWTVQPYLGPNPHDDHLHVSVVRSKQDDHLPWNLDLNPDTEETAMLPIIPTSPREDIRMLQNRLNVVFGTQLEVDGVYGPATVAAVAAHTGSQTSNTSWRAGNGVGQRQWDYLDAGWIRANAGGLSPGDEFSAVVTG